MRSLGSMSVCSAYSRGMKLTEIDGKNTQERTCVSKTSIESWCVGVDVWRSLGDQDTEENKRADPRVLFEGVNEAETEDGDYVGDHGNNDYPDGNAHSVIRHGAEDLTNNDVVDDGETSTNNDIENGAELRAPPAKRVTRGCNRTETELENRQSVLAEGCDGVERAFGPKVPV